MSEQPESAPLSNFDLPPLIEKMKQSQSWVNGELNSVILLKQHDKQIMLTALHRGTEISSFQSDASMTLQIIEGRLKLRTHKKSLLLDKGELHTLCDNINYTLVSKVETVFLLTLLKDHES